MPKVPIFFLDAHINSQNCIVEMCINLLGEDSFWACSDQGIFYSVAKIKTPTKKTTRKFNFSQLQNFILTSNAVFTKWIAFVANITCWLANCKALFFRNVHMPITSLQNQSKKPCNKQLINLKHLLIKGKSQTSALPYRPHYHSVNTARS